MCVIVVLILVVLDACHHTDLRQAKTLFSSLQNIFTKTKFHCTINPYCTPGDPLEKPMGL